MFSKWTAFDVFAPIIAVLLVLATISVLLLPIVLRGCTEENPFFLKSPAPSINDAVLYDYREQDWWYHEERIGRVISVSEDRIVVEHEGRMLLSFKRDYDRRLGPEYEIVGKYSYDEVTKTFFFDGVDYIDNP